MNDKINVFNIERFGIEDGPGIRTVVFLKGCYLNCKWCANPESQDFKSEILVKSNICISCEKCVDICPTNAIEYKDGFGYISDKTKCNLCQKCIDVCPVGAREIVGESYSESELISQILKDEQYFNTSGGGVTFTGGEPLVYSKNIRNIAKILKERGINTLVETCGFISLKNIIEINDYVDYIFFDIKQIDSKKHENLTGKSNSIILNNLKWLSENFKGDLSIRYPYIPNCNDSIEDIKKFFAYVKNIKNIKEIIFLPYHRLGLPKYLGLGRIYEMGDIESLKVSQLLYLKEIANEFNLKIKIQ